MSNPTQIKDCMHRNPVTINQSESLMKAISIIVEYKLTGLTVVDDEGGVAGILSELDCIRNVLTALYNDGDPEHIQVGEAMEHNIQSCTSDDSIVEVAQAMVDTRQRRRPVVENGRLVGQVSSNNVLWALMAHSRHKRYS
ncbi:MAG: CBS domain-containing protein [Parahaliea sp.]